MGKEKLFTLIKSPIITEQTAQLGEKLKQVVFKVDLSANKREIKQAVEKLFEVEVLKVTTSVVKGKTKRNRFGIYKKSNYKKAFVSISKDSDIQFEGIN
ncbi:MAG: 50S ribosomal protein L23 [Gammaproteobacteria bacterium]|jgi:large subunit ribosomal protein L23|nr:50S ribosomal protein L23 [Gammaproteobacteria bacterium]|tara:strand:- start:500 stop:796 length:297 start_codon:yes stop_codon:yes gene_type:complete